MNLLQMFSSYAKQNRDNWDDNISYALTSYRSTIQESTGCSPNLIMLGRDSLSPILAVFLITGTNPSTQAPICPV